MLDNGDMSVTEEIGIILSNYPLVTKEDTIFSIVFLMRKKNIKQVENVNDWDISQTSVVSRRVAIAIELLFNFDIVKYPERYTIVEKGLLDDVPKEIKLEYMRKLQKLPREEREIIKQAREIYSKEQGWD